MMDSRLRGNDGGESGNDGRESGDDGQGLRISMLMRTPWGGVLFSRHDLLSL